MTFAIQVKSRTDIKPEELRSEGRIPAVLYGHGVENISLDVSFAEFQKLFEEAGESSLIDLSIDGKEPVKVLIQDIQMDPVKHKIIHADFRQIKMGEEMHASISLEFVGVAPAEKTLGGTLITGVDMVNVKCLPTALVSSFEIDLSTLATFDDVIKIGDINIGEGITITDAPDTVVAKVIPPLTQEQLDAMDSENAVTSVENVEVEKKGKKEEESEDKK